MPVILAPTPRAPQNRHQQNFENLKDVTTKQTEWNLCLKLLFERPKMVEVKKLTIFALAIKH